MKQRVSEDTRLKILQLKTARNFSNRAIARQLLVSEGTVRAVSKKFAEFGSTADRPKSGRPKKTSQREDRKIKRLSTSNPLGSSRDIAVKLRNENQIDVSKSTVCRRLKSLELCARISSKKPFISQANRRKRLAFAKKHLHWTAAQWSNVVFSDEKKFNR